MSKPQQKYTIISIALTLIAFVLFVLASYFEELAEYSLYIMLVGLAFLVASWGIYFFSGRAAPKEESAENVITVIACKSCGQTEERAFEKGDYIFKDMGQCKKCSGSSYIKSIYAITPKKE